MGQRRPVGSPRRDDHDRSHYAPTFREDVAAVPAHQGVMSSITSPAVSSASPAVSSALLVCSAAQSTPSPTASTVWSTTHPAAPEATAPPTRPPTTPPTTVPTGPPNDPIAAPACAPAHAPARAAPPWTAPRYAERPTFASVLRVGSFQSRIACSAAEVANVSGLATRPVHLSPLSQAPRDAL